MPGSLPHDTAPYRSGPKPKQFRLTWADGTVEFYATKKAALNAFGRGNGSLPVRAHHLAKKRDFVVWRYLGQRQ